MGHLLEVKDVTKIYEGGVLANHNVNFTVDEGEIHALVGENGAGKSTLMKMLYGLESITSGHIYMNGEELKLQSSKGCHRPRHRHGASAFYAGGFPDRSGEHDAGNEKDQFRVQQKAGH